MRDDQLIEAFETCRIPQGAWRHPEHVKLAYLYLRAHPPEEALRRMRAGLKALNAVHGVPESLTRGYHETLTGAWLRLVHAILTEYGPAEDADAFYAQHPELSQPKVLRLFYSQGRLMSQEAKERFLEPDLAPLPVGGRGSG